MAQPKGRIQMVPMMRKRKEPAETLRHRVQKISFLLRASVSLWFFLFPAFLFAGSQAPLLFMTDFGVSDDSVAICKGVMLSIDPNLHIIDISHQVTPYSILDGARYLAGASPYFPSGSVFVVVIDPGVGSARKPIVVKSNKGQFFVLPDNGLMTMVAQRDGIESVREITNASWMIGTALSSTFHGRDIFSPVGAHIAHGEDWTQVGPELKDIVRLKIDAPVLDSSGLHASVIALDGPYGNLITNIDASEFEKLNYALGEKIRARIANREIILPFVKTFSDVPIQHTLLYVDSRGHMAIAINQGNFAKTYHIIPPQPITIPVKK